LSWAGGHVVYTYYHSSKVCVDMRLMQPHLEACEDRAKPETMMDGIVAADSPAGGRSGTGSGYAGNVVHKTGIIIVEVEDPTYCTSSVSRVRSEQC
jgi:hypothetical protein